MTWRIAWRDAWNSFEYAKEIVPGTYPGTYPSEVRTARIDIPPQFEWNDNWKRKEMTLFTVLKQVLDVH